MEKKGEKQAEKIDIKYNLSLYWSLVRRYGFVVAGMLLIIIYLELSHVLEKYLFKQVIDKGAAFFTDSITKAAYAEMLLLVFCIFVGLALLTVIARWLYIHLTNLLDGKLMLDVKRKFLNHLIILSHNFHSSHKTGALISKIIRSSSAVERMTDTIMFNFTPLLIQVVIATGILMYFDKLSAIIIIITVIIFVAYSLLINLKQQAANMAANDAEDFEKAVISDIFTNIDSIKYFGKEESIKAKYSAIGEKTRQAVMRHWDYFRWLSAGQNLILGTGTVFVIYFPLMAVLNKDMSIGTLVFIYTVFTGLMGNLFSFDQGIRNFYRSMADFESLFKYYKVENDINDAPDAKKLEVKRGEILFKDVSFSYRKRKIFQGLTLKIPKNRKVAIIGPSGSGKTTLVRLMYRLYDVECGEILIDGKNVKEFKQESLRSELSIVPQECVLFDDTVYNNIAFSNPNASREQVFEAMRFAQLDKVVENFPNREETLVGERGVKLSGGEKQRVSIARAILADKKVLVLDEATSSLDSETEHEIQKDLARLMKGRTSIIIAHRLSTIMSADTIVVLDKGRIVQSGKHSQLIKQEGLYKKLWNLQKGGYID
ncbi:MAG: ABC transporter ATP-binding protein [archaeon]